MRNGTNTNIRAKDFLLIPNLLSLLRIFLAPVIYIILVSEVENNSLYAFIILFIAALSDLLDGILARKLNQISSLGLILDPLADKILATATIIAMILVRDFPLWIAVLIIARDLIILISGLILKKRKNYIPISDLIGKYYFGSIAALLLSYIIQFEFGKTLFLYSTVSFLALTSFSYGRIFWMLMQDRDAVPLFSKPIYAIILRIIAIIALSLSSYRLYFDNLADLLY